MFCMHKGRRSGFSGEHFDPLSLSLSLLGTYTITLSHPCFRYTYSLSRAHSLSLSRAHSLSFIHITFLLNGTCVCKNFFPRHISIVSFALQFVSTKKLFHFLSVSLSFFRYIFSQSILFHFLPSFTIFHSLLSSLSLFPFILSNSIFYFFYFLLLYFFLSLFSFFLSSLFPLPNPF